MAVGTSYMYNKSVAFYLLFPSDFSLLPLKDTVVALQALSKYESTQHQGDMDFVATIKGNGINHSFAFDEDNKLVTQRAPINSLPTSLTLTMVGQGCAVFQVRTMIGKGEPHT